MVRLSKLFLPSLFHPNLFFEEIILKRDASFKTDIKPEILYDFVKKITERIDNRQITFEHLKMSKSKLHKNYSPYSEKTFLVMKKIIDDLFMKTE